VSFDPPAWIVVLAVMGLPFLVFAFLVAPVAALADALRRRRREPEAVTHWIVLLALSLLALPFAPLVALAYAAVGRRGSDWGFAWMTPRFAAMLGGSLLIGSALMAPLLASSLDETRRLSKCHDPEDSDVERVRDVLEEPMLREPVAVRHRGTTFLAVSLRGRSTPATFGIQGDQVVAVNEEAQRSASVPFDFLFGSGGVLGTDARGRDIDAGRKAAIRRVESCAGDQPDSERRSTPR
jgi:hypothetical protein